jgi:hypothetical protein
MGLVKRLKIAYESGRYHYDKEVSKENVAPVLGTLERIAYKIGYRSKRKEEEYGEKIVEERG